MNNEKALDFNEFITTSKEENEYYELIRTQINEHDEFCKRIENNRKVQVMFYYLQKYVIFFPMLFKSIFDMYYGNTYVAIFDLAVAGMSGYFTMNVAKRIIDIEGMLEDIKEFKNASNSILEICELLIEKKQNLNEVFINSLRLYNDNKIEEAEKHLSKGIEKADFSCDLQDELMLKVKELLKKGN